MFTSCQKDAGVLAPTDSISMEAEQLKTLLTAEGFSNEVINQAIQTLESNENSTTVNNNLEDIPADVLQGMQENSNSSRVRAACTNGVGSVTAGTTMNFNGYDLSNPSNFMSIFESTTLGNFTETSLPTSIYNKVVNLDCGSHKGTLLIKDGNCPWEVLATKKVTYDLCF